MKKARLLKLADFLDGLRPRQFDLSSWVSKFPKSGKLGDCGTVACACGWAATIPSFRRAGFRMSSSMPVFGNYVNWTAVREFFGLSFNEASWLFGEGHYEKGTPTQVARRIRKFVGESSKAASPPSGMLAPRAKPKASRDGYQFEYDNPFTEDDEDE